jgi:hypothetical protein
MSEGMRPTRHDAEITARAQLGRLLVTRQDRLGEVLLPADPTRFEAVTCVGLEPEQSVLYAVVEVRQEIGYNGDLCTGPGALEYVRFFADWDGDGDFTDPDEDLGVSSVAVHDIPGPKPLSYVVSLQVTHEQLVCFLAGTVAVRAVLEFNMVPPAGDPDPQIIWGNILDVHVQPKPQPLILLDVLEQLDVKVPGQLAELVDADVVVAKPPAKPSPEELVRAYGDKVPPHRSLTPQLAALDAVLAANAGAALDLPATAAAVLPASLLEQLDIGAVLGNYFGPIGDTTFEELHCVGLHPGLSAVVGVLTIKLPSGYSGGLCSAGSLEYVSFWADWEDDGVLDEFLGTAVVQVHDEAVPADGISFAVFLPVNLAAHQRPCGEPHTARIRAVLSWNTPPPANPYLLPRWGNAVESFIQLPVGTPVVGQVPFLSTVGGMAVNQIDASGYATGTAVTAGFYASDSPFAGEVVLAGHIANPPDLSAGATQLTYGLHYREESEPPGTAHDITNTFQATISQYSAFFWTQTNVNQIADPGTHEYPYLEDLTANGPGGDLTFVEGFVLGRWETGGLPDGRYEVWFTVDTGSGPVDSNHVWVRLDNTAPVADITAVGSPFLPQGTPLQAVVTATDDNFSSYGLGVLPAGYPHAPVPPAGLLPVTASPVSLDTTGVTPGGYVLHLSVADRAIVNSGFVGQVSTDDIGFCVEAP